MNMVTIMTTMVRLVASFLVGHVTLRSSPTVSFRYLRRAFGCLRATLLSSFPLATSFSLFQTNLSHQTETILVKDFGTGKTPPIETALPIDQAGQAGIEPATPGFGDRCSAKLSYWPKMYRRVNNLRIILLQRIIFITWLRDYLVSRCSVCLRQHEQNFLNSIRPGSLRLFFSVV